MTYEQKVLSIFTILGQAFAIIRATWQQSLKILLLGFLMPQIGLILYFDVAEKGVVAGLREATTSLAHRRNAASFDQLLRPAWDYGVQLGSFLPIVFCCMLIAYMAVVHVCVHHVQSGTALPLPQALARGMRAVFPRGIVLVLLTILAAGVARFLGAPLVRVMMVLACMIPVILAVEQKGAFWSFKAALTLQYVRNSNYSVWNVFFALMVIALGLYLVSVEIGSLVGPKLITLDQVLGLPRAFWHWTFPGASFGPTYFLLLGLETVFTILTLILAPALTVALYFAVVERRDVARA